MKIIRGRFLFFFLTTLFLVGCRMDPEKTLVGLEITRPASKTVYLIGESIETDGLRVEAVFEDGTRRRIFNYVLSPSADEILTEEGPVPVSIIYRDREVSFDVEVRKPFEGFVEQPEDSSFDLYSRNQSLNVSFMADSNGYITFQWYRRYPNEKNFTRFHTSTKVRTQRGGIYSSEVSLSRTNYVKAEYECRVVFQRDGETEVFVSDRVTVTQTIPTSLPTVCIDTENSRELVNKDDKINCVFTIYDEDGNILLSDGNTVFSGRGNSTWVKPKKPYKIKLDKKASVLGMPSHKQWMLIANYRDMSFMKNEVAFCLSEMLDMSWTVHGRFVNLVKNNEYEGLYWIGEQIKVDKNRVAVDDDDYLLEVDSYFDETWKFKSEIRNLPYQVKNDSSMTTERLEELRNKINALERVLYSPGFPYDSSFTDLIDVKSFAQFYLVNEIMDNTELLHPKSCFFTFDSSENILKAGPVWDFDWAAGTYETNQKLKDSIYYDALFKTTEFRDALNEEKEKLSSQRVSDRIAQLSDAIESSVMLDGIRWGTSNRNPVGERKGSWNEYVAYLEKCVNTRLEYMKELEF